VALQQPAKAGARAQCGLGLKPSTAMFLVAPGMRTTRPSSSLLATTWQPSRDLQEAAAGEGAEEL
jgi:hypothetical protein